MEALAKRLRATRLLGPLSTDQLSHLLEQSGITTARAGDVIIREGEEMRGHLLLINGEMEAQRTWMATDGTQKSHTWNLNPAKGNSNFAFLGAASRVGVRAVTDVSYYSIDADSVDELVGWEHQFSEDLHNDQELRRRMDLIKQVKLFHNVPLENVRLAFERMYARKAQAGETIVTQGEEGDSYFLMDKGEAEVIRRDPFTDEAKRVAILGSGDAFGEEALLQGGYRNATVKMVTPGQLLVLSKTDFDELLRPSIVEEITPDQALEILKKGEAKLLDCRYEMEFSESRIPGAVLAPLDSLRSEVHNLDPEQTYVVYCRSGRRSLAAVFLLRERNIKSMSLVGGIKAWPFEVDASPLEE